MSLERTLRDRAELIGELREVVEALAPLERAPCSAGERQAADWIAERMRALADEVALELEPSWGIFPPNATLLGLLGVLGAGLVLAGRRRAGALLAAASFAGVVDEAQNGPRIVRRALRRERRTVNVVARATGTGDAPEPWTLIVLAHHDAAQTGMLFDQTLQRRVHELAPWLIERARTAPPQWWIGLAGPLCTLLAALRGRAGLARTGLAIGALGSALVADVWRSRTVPGANDNLSGVAALLALARRLRAQPAPGVEVWLVSCGAEETLQDGIRAFIARHRHELPERRCCVVNLDTIGSPTLAMLEAEGPVWMESYQGRWLRDALAEHAAQLGIPLERGFRARSSTDSVIPSRAGFATATLVSLTAWRAPANYHLPSDVPANLDYGTVADAVRLVHRLALALSAQAGLRPESLAACAGDGRG